MYMYIYPRLSRGQNPRKQPLQCIRNHSIFALTKEAIKAIDTPIFGDPAPLCIFHQKGRRILRIIKEILGMRFQRVKQI